jgi:hypothetical protein
MEITRLAKTYASLGQREPLSTADDFSWSGRAESIEQEEKLDETSVNYGFIPVNER